MVIVRLNARQGCCRDKEVTQVARFSQCVYMIMLAKEQIVIRGTLEIFREVTVVRLGC
jgi:hypothetical protein